MASNDHCSPSLGQSNRAWSIYPFLPVRTGLTAGCLRGSFWASQSTSSRSRQSRHQWAWYMTLINGVAHSKSGSEILATSSDKTTSTGSCRHLLHSPELPTSFAAASVTSSCVFTKAVETPVLSRNAFAPTPTCLKPRPASVTTGLAATATLSRLSLVLLSSGFTVWETLLPKSVIPLLICPRPSSESTRGSEECSVLGCGTTGEARRNSSFSLLSTELIRDSSSCTTGMLVVLRRGNSGGLSPADICSDSNVFKTALDLLGTGGGRLPLDCNLPSVL